MEIYKELVKSLKNFIESKYEGESTIIQFGSTLTNKKNPKDIDILIFLDEKNETLIKNILRDFAKKKKCNVFVYNAYSIKLYSDKEKPVIEVYINKKEILNYLIKNNEPYKIL